MDALHWAYATSEVEHGSRERERDVEREMLRKREMLRERERENEREKEK